MRGAGGRHRPTRQSAHVASFVRDALTGGRRGPAHDPSAAGPRGSDAHDRLSPPVAAPLTGGAQSARGLARPDAGGRAAVACAPETAAAMSRPAVEVAEILHAQGDTFVEQHPWLSVQQRSVLRAIARCRTAALGGHVDRCDACGHQAISYNSCRNRHCPKCQAQARERWVRARERELLDVPYVHVVFTLPHGLLPLAHRNSARLYTWLFHASATTLRAIAADPQHLGAE